MVVFVALAAGIVVGRYLPLPPGLWAAAGLAALAAAGATLRRRHLHGLSAAAVVAAIFFGGAFSAVLAYHRLDAGHVAAYCPGRSILATVRGRVASRPRLVRPEAETWRLPRTTFHLRVEAIRRTDGAWAEAHGDLPVTVGEPVDGLDRADRVELVGRLHPIYPPGNPGQYDRQAAGRIRGEHAAFSVPGADGVRKTASPRSALARLWWRLAELTRDSVAGADEGEGGALLEALVLGERDPALRELNVIMVEAGTAHLLSISGQHLAIFLGMVYLLCRLLACPPRRSAAIVLCVLTVYVLLAEPDAPLLRSAIMAAAVCVATLSGRGVSTINALAAAGVILLVIDPLQLFSPGFQLSFGIVCGIVVLYGPIRRRLFGRWLARRGLRVYRDRHRLGRWLTDRTADGLIATVCVSLAAYVSSAPLVAYHFGIFSPYAALLSTLMLPVMVLVLGPAYAAMALALPAPNLSAAIGDLACAAAGMLSSLARWTQALPGLSLDVRPVPAWLVAAAYATMALWTFAGRGRRVLLAAVAATLLVAGGFAWTQRPAARPARAALHVLDVGHGSMCLLHGADGRTILFDAGSLDQSDPYRQVLRPFLRARRLPSPEAAFISHANIDHYSALPGLIGRNPPRRVYVNEFFGRREDDAPEAIDLLRQLSRAGIEIVRLRRGQTVQVGATRVEVLWPPGMDEAPDLEANDGSLVLRVSGGGASVLLPGDAGRQVEAILAADPPAVRAEALLLPHHGSLTPTLGAFIDAVNPEVIVQSASTRRDTPEMSAALAGRQRYVTSRDGWIHLDLDDPVTAGTFAGDR